MSTTNPTPQLDRILDMLQEIRSQNQGQRVFDVLEVVRDEVNGLSHQHESIRDEIRSLQNAVLTQQGSASD